MYISKTTDKVYRDYEIDRMFENGDVFLANVSGDFYRFIDTAWVLIDGVEHEFSFFDETELDCYLPILSVVSDYIDSTQLYLKSDDEIVELLSTFWNDAEIEGWEFTKTEKLVINGFNPSDLRVFERLNKRGMYADLKKGLKISYAGKEISMERSGENYKLVVNGTVYLVPDDMVHGMNAGKIYFENYVFEVDGEIVRKSVK